VSSCRRWRSGDNFSAAAEIYHQAKEYYRSHIAEQEIVQLAKEVELLIRVIQLMLFWILKM
jgi:hypothetical protein